MKLKMSYEIRTKTVLPKEIEVAREDRVFIFHVDDAQMLSKITIVADIHNPEKFYSEITLTPNEYSKAHFHMKRDNDLYDSVIKDFQDLESLLSLSFNVKGIDWNTETYELICETQEEKDKVGIHSFQTRGGFPDDPVSTTEDRFRDTLNRKERLSRLTLFLSFYREGKNEYNELKFINAFYNFYFVLEGMYGKGKTKNRDVANEFKKSTELRDFAQTVIDEHIMISQEHQAQLNKMLSLRNMTLGVDAILELIVKTRGDLYHFTGNPNKPVQGTPFNHKDFRTISFIAMGLSLHAILFRVVEINMKTKAKSH